MPNTNPTSQTKGTWKCAALNVLGAITAATLTLTGALAAASLTLTTPLQKAYLTGAAKRVVVPVELCPETGSIAASTTYKGWACPGYAGKVVKVVALLQTAVTGGTGVMKVLKAASNGNTCLGTATFDATTLVANTATSLALTGTAADLAITAAQGIYLELVTGSGASGANLTVFVIFELDDF